MSDLAAGPREAFGGPPEVLKCWRLPLRPPRPLDQAWPSALPTRSAASGEGGPSRKPAPSPRAPPRILPYPFSLRPPPRILPHPFSLRAPPRIISHPFSLRGPPRIPPHPFSLRPPPPRIPSHAFSLGGGPLGFLPTHFPFSPPLPPRGSFPRGPGSRVRAGPGVGGGVKGGLPGSEAHIRARGPLAGWGGRALDASRGYPARRRGPGRAGVGCAGPSSERCSRAFADAEGPPHLAGGPERPRPRARAAGKVQEGNQARPGGGARSPNPGRAPSVRLWRVPPWFRAASLSGMDPEAEAGLRPALSRNCNHMAMDLRIEDATQKSTDTSYYSPGSFGKRIAGSGSLSSLWKISLKLVFTEGYKQIPRSETVRTDAH
ncbi:protein enabled-like [Cervus canadensis]|uniref:protein enabled-like n=1 Tax=Cervus canadensis TaxID=1574408 RepID=UPI001C9E6212|nr:protein enabled-like [Cervus canadensis]